MLLFENLSLDPDNIFFIPMGFRRKFARICSDTMSATAHLQCGSAIQTGLSWPDENMNTGVSGPDVAGNPRSKRIWRSLESMSSRRNTVT